MKDLNKKEAGDLLDAFKEVCERFEARNGFFVFNNKVVQGLFVYNLCKATGIAVNPTLSENTDFTKFKPCNVTDLTFF